MICFQCDPDLFVGFYEIFKASDKLSGINRKKGFVERSTKVKGVTSKYLKFLSIDSIPDRKPESHQ